MHSVYTISIYIIYLLKYQVIIFYCEVISLVTNIAQGIGQILKIWHQQAIDIN